MKITSPAFEHGAPIPDRFSRYADDLTPPLNFDDVPADALSLALIMDDPDAPHGLFTHWIVFNIDQNTSGFAENQAPPDVRHGTNSWGEARYGGPRPPDREHRYFFHLYALDQRLDLPNGATRQEIEDAITGHILAEAELMGRYAPPVHA
jgi:Raf kinase inhibitor-like YbhB/YbcL family protein